ncbi:putative d-isomer specific 2-hydroxyacid dehydrogenase family protein [Neofusicoccum parvum UCRNP2]|uniref:Putative d-isomer specific 2-hydroxyacid dehydrogenase family protein n=1 Tax=Botryosphaeria parva (strain UCR-NP2) TaxID=1287680 RepID=R1E7N5_BOTPV|nr:putative d-isomer specific 2-hydroxyacid dehydrogenase family protein [Neofusicoccum parvum UCRNP2]
MVHHRIVALEAVHTPTPAFELPHPHTYDITVHQRTEPHQLHERIRDATIVINVVAPINAAALSPEVTPHLKLIAVMAAGTDSIDLDACRRRGIRVMNCAHANVQSVAEHALGMYFAARRRTLIMHERSVGTLGDGTEWEANNTLTPHMRAAGRAPLNCGEEVVAILGNGAIGKRFAHLARLLDMRVLVAARKGDSKPQPDRVSFEDALAKATAVVLTLPRTPDTMNLISTAEFATMRPEAVLINVSRGGIVDEAALVQALRAGQIAGAATDVFAKEPARGGEAANNILLGPEPRGLNLTVSPHVAWYGEKTMENYQRILKENVEGWVVGKEQNVVA